MKTSMGLVLGLIGYGAWKLSEPQPGEPSDIKGRLERLKQEWSRATEQGKLAGEARRRQMEQEFEAIFNK
jgi:hypothetical protein